MINDGEAIVITVPSQAFRDDDGVITIEVPGEIAVVPERCYRALVKFALSVIPEAELAHLAATVDWVRLGVRPVGRPLPLVQGAVMPFPPDPSAQLAVYARKAERAPLPHVVCEFRLGCFLYVFQLPFSNRDGDEPLFIGEPAFFDVFQHYRRVGHWRPYDLGGREPLDSRAVLRMVPHTNDCEA
jgi:hypothetical protein